MFHAVSLFTVQVNLPHLPTSANFYQDTISHIPVVHQRQVRLMHSPIREYFFNSSPLPSSYCSHRIESYHSISHLLQKSEAFQSVHHVTFILCYTGNNKGKLTCDKSSVFNRIAVNSQSGLPEP